MKKGVYIYTAFLISFSANSQEQLWFDPALISGDPDLIADLSRLTHSGQQLPGAYSVDIWLNGKYLYNRKMNFVDRSKNNHERNVEKGGDSVHDDTGLLPCITDDDLSSMGVKLTNLKRSNAECAPLGSIINSSWAEFDFQKMRLNINIPQSSIIQKASGEIPEEFWDEGVNAATLSYNFTGYKNHSEYGDSSSHTLTVNSGININAWRLRDNSYWSHYSSDYYSYNQWQHQSLYAERDIIPFKSTLTLGDTNTSGNVFDSIGIRGVQIGTSEEMYPNSLRGYAPILKGIANSNAEVTVEQNGYVIYRMNVPQGPFEINDLNPVYAGGDLQVFVKEASGNIRNWSVPYTSLPVLQREGYVKYGVSVGRYRSNDVHHYNPVFAEGSVVWGLPYDLTPYGGLQLSEKYQSAAVGIGLDMGSVGAISVDVTHAKSTLVDGSQNTGQSYSFTYAHSFNTSGTSLQVTGYQYSTKGYYTLAEAASKYMQGWKNDTEEYDSYGRRITNIASDWYNLSNTKRQRVDISLRQNIGDYGQVYLAGSHQTYWNSDKGDDSLQMGYSGNVGATTYTISYTTSSDSTLSGIDRTVNFSLSIPISWFSRGSTYSNNNLYATLNSSHNSSDGTSWNGGLSGSMLDDRSLDWSLSKGYSQSGGDMSNANVNWSGTYARTNLGYTHANDYSQTSYGASGGAILYRNGLTFGQQLGTTSILVEAPEANGVSLYNHTGVKTDWRGNAIIPNATPYKENKVSLNVKDLPLNIDVDNPVTRVIPTSGAVSIARFNTRKGDRVFMTLSHNGKPLPFGTTVTIDNYSSIVGDDGEIYFSGLPSEGTLHAQWSKRKIDQCSFDYILPETGDDTNEIKRLAASCE